MSAVTLETVQADYEATRTALLNEDSGLEPGMSLGDMFPDLIEYDVDKWATSDPVYAWRCADLIRIARQLIVFQIDRDYGRDAALLYKLSDGNIDPRNTDRP